ncbi:glycosyltransferase family 2 protein [Campylobacter lari]|nr:glycosyltransferase family 2 protein [Campylobacter lari]
MLKKTKTVGVVIPIYNVEKYLKECLDSVINQTYTNLEIILVNDGSTDENSLNIAKEYTLKDKRITLFDKKNGGLSSARNVAIEYFSGEYKLKNKTQTIKENSLIEFNIEGNNPYEIYTVYKSYKAFNNEQDLTNFTYPIIDYIIFLDSDDYWELNCIEECVPRMDGVEVVWFDWKRFYDDVEKPIEEVENHTWMILKNKTIISSLEWIEEMERLGNKLFAFCIQGMISFEYLHRIQLKFIDGIVSEDFHFGILLFAKSKYIHVLDKKLYTYRIRTNSICSHEGTVSEKSISPYIKDLYNIFNKDGLLTKIYYYKYSCLVMSFEILKYMGTYCNAKMALLIKKIFLAGMLSEAFGVEKFNIDPYGIQVKYHILNDLLSIQKPKGAVHRVQNQLAYRLGYAVIENGKNIFKIWFLPLILLGIFLSYRQEKKIYNKNIQKNPALKLPPLEIYEDYSKALKYKEHLSYKIGQEMLQCLKQWHKGRIFLLPIRIIKICKNYKKI